MKSTHSTRPIQTILVTGGAGYVGAVLVPKLLEKGFAVRVYDLFLYGTHVFPSCHDHPKLKLYQADLRDPVALQEALTGVDAVIHLACISNDPSFELNPNLGKSINYDAFVSLVELSKRNKIKRFVYASSSSVYGIKDDPQVTEGRLHT